ncbi:hypothetical protein JM79_3207 [Gramella sp. Hel_I_59]|uniref:hypothetical protein n=1 Tax=Gramella sp. Hel_I_59 TaxID=1249978 RepID=UPI00114E71CB|nr:hypothetical protein [Gramella sp. Hel_I_59]TQI72250.1 hypothetical protein JM79_3207 [Gramella sp. Hel_I_59]
METIFQIIQENSKKTGNGSGISLSEICGKSPGIILPLIKRHLNNLVKEKKIYYRQGINQTLFFSNNL